MGVPKPTSRDLSLPSKTLGKHWEKRVHSYSTFSPFLISMLSNLMIISSQVLCRIVDSVIVKTYEMKEKLVILEEHVIPNGVNYNFFKPQLRLP